MGAFRAEVMAIVGARTLSFHELRACGAPAFYGQRDLVASRIWLAVMANTTKMSVRPRMRRSDMLPAY